MSGGNIIFPATAGRGVYFGAETSGGSYGYVREISDGQLAFGSDDAIRFYETDADTLRVDWSLNTGTFNFIGTLREDGNDVWHAGNDGSGSGLDADLLDGLQPSVSAVNNTIVQRHPSGYIYANYFNTSPNDVSSSITKICCETGNDGFIRHATAAGVVDFIKSADGSGSGLDADTLDSLESTQFLRSDVSDSVAAGRKISFFSYDNIESGSGDQASLEVFQDTAGADAFMQFHVGSDFAAYFGLDGSTNDFAVGGWSMGANKYKVWHQGNDGSGSGLDADLLDGQQGSVYMRKSADSQLDMNNNDIVGVDQIVHEGDTNTYIQFHAADQWRVVTGGAERFEVNNSLITSSEPINAPDFNSTSDRALKEDIVQITDALEKVQQLNGYTFTYKSDKTRAAGVIAQEVEQVLPEVVHGEEGSKSVSYGNMVSLLIEAVKEQQQQIEGLKEQLVTLREKIK
jgi:hypothetical protein